MDFWKKSCAVLCKQLVSGEINDVKSLDSFVEKMCKEYKGSNDEVVVMKDEKKVLKPLYSLFKDNRSFGGNVNDNVKCSSEYINYLTQFKKALEKLGKITNVKFFSIFLGIGTGKYYRSAARDIGKMLKESKNMQKKSERQPSSDANKKFIGSGSGGQKAAPKVYSGGASGGSKIVSGKLWKLQKTTKSGNIGNVPKDVVTDDPGIFRGLPNGSNYCYLNTALQNLYHNRTFADKVLKANVPESDDNYKELRATQFFFKYLSGKISKSVLENPQTGRKVKAKDLGYGVAGGTSQKNSVHAQLNIERHCMNQLRRLAQKSPRDALYSSEELEDPIKEDTPVKQIEEALKALYDDKELRERITNGVDVAQLTEAERKGNTEFGLIRNFFIERSGKSWSAGKLGEFANKLKNIRFGFDRRDFDIVRAKRRLEDRLNKLERRKRAYLLTLDAKITLSEPIQDVLSSISFSLNQDQCFYLPLKNRRFVIELTDRGDASTADRQNFSVEEILELSGLVASGRLKVFIKNQELDASKCKFRLVSVTIGTGGHYRSYQHESSGWKHYNDAVVTSCKWNDIQDDIGTKCELLTYELV